MVGFIPPEWKSRAKDMLYRIGVTGRSKHRLADEMTPGQLRAERERRAGEAAQRDKSAGD